MSRRRWRYGPRLRSSSARPSCSRCCTTSSARWSPDVGDCPRLRSSDAAPTKTGGCARARPWNTDSSRGFYDDRYLCIDILRCVQRRVLGVGVPEVTLSLPTDAQARKALPIVRGVLDYFPDALLAVAEVSRIGNEQHNPGEPM